MKTKIYMAPMSGITDLSFRLISRRFGAAHCFFEMLDANATLYGHPKNRYLIKTLKKDSPIAAQLVGSEPSVMLAAAEKLTSLVKITSLDVNSACPAKKVIKKGAGAALLNDAPRLGRIVKRLSSGLRIPVTVKIRAGFDKRDAAGCVRIAKTCQENGASAVFIHGRTVLQGYYGDIDYGSIKAVKDALGIPVFGSGNIFDPFMAGKMLDETGCDGIVVARGALGNPWIFRDIEGFLKNGALPEPPGLPEKKKILKDHLACVEKYKDMARANKIGFMGKIAMWYLKGLPDIRRVRERICRVRSYKELALLIDRV